MKKKIISNVVTVGFLVAFLWYGLTNKDMLQALGNVAVWSLLLVAAGKMIVFVSNGLFTKWTAELFTKKFSLAHGIYITILSAIGNFFGPLLGGASIRAVYLKKYHNLSYSKFTATLMGYYLILFISNALLAILSLVLLPKTHQTGFLIGFFVVWLLFMVGISFVRLPKRHRFKKLEQYKLSRFVLKVLYEIEEGWQVLIKNRVLLTRLLFLAFLSLGGTYFVSFIEFQALGIPLNVGALGLYTAIVATSLLLSLTPGAIGIRESLLVLVGTTLDISNHQIVQIAIIDRGVHFLLLGFLYIATRHSSLRKSLTEADSTSEAAHET